MSGNGLSTSQSNLQSKQAKKLPQYIAAFSGLLGSLSAGAVLGWTGNITEELRKGEFNNIEIAPTDIKWIGSCATLGAMLLCFPTGFLCEKLGRKTAILVLAALFIIGWLFIIFANSVGLMYVGRIITGMASGAFLPASAVYLSEVAEKEIRGKIVTIGGCLPVGIMVAYTLGYVLPIKIYTIVSALIPVVFLITFLFQPETPIYSMRKGKEAEARSALIRLRGSSYNIDAELKEIKTAIERDRKSKVSFKDSLMKRSTRRAALISFSLMFFQQASGIKATVFYTSNIFQASGADLNPKIATTVIGVVQLISTLVSSLVVDRLGRRILLLLSGAFMAIGLIILGIFYTLFERSLVSPETLSSLGFMPLLGLSLFNIAFPLGYGPIAWMICGEIFPPEIKGVATAAASTFNWFIAFIITNLYFDLKQAIGGDLAFYLFATVCTVGVFFVFFVVPETKGKSLYEIQMELEGTKEQLGGVENTGFNMKNINSYGTK
ncbi:hypothetical protein ILUMI_18070 [Ignelater luminosus]|uniref:Major facilitator superfamily (MFS) profile domain-containing protein n=1 Tax=Ignelater luminosus TaxID=2038154 RepID=A0A8K0G796_IGNLU|nr:hypothetical protein ILUMI_18070 [Ignelater luminosus]